MPVADPEPSAYDLETQAILRRATEGEEQAFRRLYERVAPALHGWATLRMGPAFRRRVDPQEVVQEVWLRALERIGELDPQKPFRPWIFRVARFVLIEMSRKLPRGAGRGAESTGATTYFRAQPDPATGVSTRVTRGDVVEAFLVHAQTLRGVDRELVVLHGLEGLSFEEIAERTGSSVEALGKRWQRLRARLVELGPPDYLL